MRRAGGWLLGIVAVAAMAGGAWLVFRPILNRQTLTVAFVRTSYGRDPSNDAVESGAAFALRQAGGRAGDYKVRLVAHKDLGDVIPAVWLGNSDSISVQPAVDPPPLTVSAFEVPFIPLGDIRLMGGFETLGRRSAEWAKKTGARRVALIGDEASSRSKQLWRDFDQAAGEIGLTRVARLETSDTSLIVQTIAAAPDLVFFTGEEAPYSTTEKIFAALREKGYPGRLVLVDIDPEVSFLAVPSKLPAGALLISTIAPPSAEFAAAYEPATGRKAGPHAWPGYVAMTLALQVIDQSARGHPDELRRTSMRIPRPEEGCSLYVVRDGRFEFVERLAAK